MSVSVQFLVTLGYVSVCVKGTVTTAGMCFGTVSLGSESVCQYESGWLGLCVPMCDSSSSRAAVGLVKVCVLGPNLDSGSVAVSVFWEPTLRANGADLPSVQHP